MTFQEAAKELQAHWRNADSAVTACKYAYRLASKVQRAQIRAWMRLVLSGKDSTT